MPGVLKEYLYLHELPFMIEDKAKDGYTHFEIDLIDVKKPRRERVVVRFWKAKKILGKQLHCPGTETEACDHPPFQNSTALDQHQRARKHGPYAVKPGQIILEAGPTP